MTDAAVNPVEAHYEELLSSRYTWMMGGFAACHSSAKALLDAAGITPRPGDAALDLGAGAGFHARVLAERGFDVVAVDTSDALLAELRQACTGFSVTPIRASLLDTHHYRARGPFSVILCVGDTLTHLSSQREVGRLIDAAAALLAPDGMLVLQYREQATDLRPQDSSFVLRSERDRIMECVLHFEPAQVWVTDIVHEWASEMWRTTRSSYPKLRIPLEALMAQATAAGLTAQRNEIYARQRLLVLRPSH